MDKKQRKRIKIILKIEKNPNLININGKEYILLKSDDYNNLINDDLIDYYG